MDRRINIGDQYIKTNSNGLRFDILTVAKITPQGKLRLSNGDLIGSSLEYMPGGSTFFRYWHETTPLFKSRVTNPVDTNDLFSKSINELDEIELSFLRYYAKQLL